MRNNTEQCDGSCAGNELGDCSHAADKKLAETKLREVRAHPEYQAMLANLTNTQNRCTQFLMAMRRTRKGLRDHSLNRFEATALVERELDGVDGSGPG